MEEPFCDQTKAYKPNTGMGADLNAIIIYEQLKEAIELLERSLGEDERLLALWYGPNGAPLIVEHIGYQGQSFIVLKGKDKASVESIALIHADLTQIVFQIAKGRSDGDQKSIAFMGHSARAD